MICELYKAHSTFEPENCYAVSPDFIGICRCCEADCGRWKELGSRTSLPLNTQSRCSAGEIELIYTNASHVAGRLASGACGLAAAETLLFDPIAMVRPSSCRKKEVRTRHILTVQLLIPPRLVRKSIVVTFFRLIAGEPCPKTPVEYSDRPDQTK